MKRSALKFCQVCGNAFSRPKGCSWPRWSKVKFCSQRCMGLSRRIDPLTRIKRSVTIAPNGCWLWKGYKDKGDYGIIAVNGRPRKASQVIFELSYGSIPSGKHLRHKCGNRSCISPKHLELVSPFEHVERVPKGLTFINRFKTHCLRGHEFTKENTYVDRDGGRECRKCRKVSQQAYKAKLKNSLK
jgi:hypothetical protein